jgi:glutathione synthase/RimK-type ligase-like ATP-grasp enzyme
VRIALATCLRMPELWFDDAPLRDALVRRGHGVDAVPWQRLDGAAYDLVVIRSAWDYTGRHRDFLDWAASVPRLVNPYDVVAPNTHKSYLLSLGVPVVPTVLLPAGSSWDARSCEWPRAVVKPAVGAGGRDALAFRRRRPRLAQQLVDRLLPEGDLLVQPYLPSVETSGERSLVFVGGEYSHCVRRPPYLLTKLDADSWPVEAAPDEVELATAAVPPGLAYARVDLLRDGRGRPVVAELELVEPQLFLRHAPGAAERLADAITDA